MGNICQNVQEQIPELITGALSAEKVAELQRHTCRRCKLTISCLEILQK
jgi:hypothetical protein